MIMAFDSSQTPPSRLDPTVIAGLRTALVAYLSQPDERAPLQSALESLAADARAKAMLPEHLLVVLKEVWSSLPEARAMTDTAAQVSLLQRVVTMCITEYYS